MYRCIPETGVASAVRMVRLPLLTSNLSMVELVALERLIQYIDFVEGSKVSLSTIRSFVFPDTLRVLMLSELFSDMNRIVFPRPPLERVVQ